MSTLVANRYARALAAVVAQDGDFGKIQQELDRFATLLAENPELRQVLTSPAVPLPRRKAVLEAILNRLDFSRIASNFFYVLLNNIRIGILEEVCKAFRHITDERRGIVRVQVRVARPLSEQQENALQHCFRRLTSREVELEFSPDPSLLGGVVARVGSTVYDGSLKGQLERLRERLRSESTYTVPRSD